MVATMSGRFLRTIRIVAVATATTSLCDPSCIESLSFRRSVWIGGEVDHKFIVRLVNRDVRL